MLPVLRKINLAPYNRRNLWNDIDEAFDGLLNRQLSVAPPVGGVDVYEDEDKLHIEADLPGFKRDEISLTLEDGVLRLEAQRGEVAENKEANYFVQERQTQRWARSINLPVDVDESKITANYKHGVLSVAMEKPAQSKPHNIEIH